MLESEETRGAEGLPVEAEGRSRRDFLGLTVAGGAALSGAALLAAPALGTVSLASGLAAAAIALRREG